MIFLVKYRGVLKQTTFGMRRRASIYRFSTTLGWITTSVVYVPSPTFCKQNLYHVQ